MDLHRFANPARFQRITTAVLPWSAGLAIVLLPLGRYLALPGSPPDYQQRDTARTLHVNVPIIKFSVDWWSTLHQPASVVRMGGPAIDTAMLAPLLVMAAGFAAFFVTVLILRVRTEMTLRKLRVLRLAQVQG